MTLARIVLIAVVGALALVLLVAWVVGQRLPETHVASVTRDLDAPAERVAALIRDVETQPQWRRGVTSITVHERTDSILRYVEIGGNGELPYAFREVEAGRVFTSTIDTDALPFGGSWTFTIEPADSAHTRVTIREDGVVRSAMFRLVGTYIIGHTRTIEQYLADLSAKLAAG